MSELPDSGTPWLRDPGGLDRPDSVAGSFEILSEVRRADPDGPPSDSQPVMCQFPGSDQLVYSGGAQLQLLGHLGDSEHQSPSPTAASLAGGAYPCSIALRAKVPRQS